ncbi:MAG TPA: hypothetical protein VG148_02160 [Pyrinomonadaceae bacterium]|nr:hypothetical protein [Pyrinomonadaceae bacterium]
MRFESDRACAPRARDARLLPAAALAALVLAAFALARVTTEGEAHALNEPQENAKPAAAATDAAAVVGAWQARLPAGLLAGWLVLVPDGDGLAGAFVGYDYAGPVNMDKPAEGAPPKIAMRTGSVLRDLKREGDRLTFRMTLRHPSPPPGRPAGFEVTGEVKFEGEGRAELKLSAPVQPEPLTLRLTRE